jgi:hypothetical protein
VWSDEGGREHINELGRDCCKDGFQGLENSSRCCCSGSRSWVRESISVLSCSRKPEMFIRLKVSAAF